MNFSEILEMFPSELRTRVLNLENFDQRRDKHPEGNVLNHTIAVFNRLRKHNDIGLLLAAVFHDIGKDSTASTHPTKGHITHYGHEKVSADLVIWYADLIEEFGCSVDRVQTIKKNHMRIKCIDKMRPSKQSKMREMDYFNDLVLFNAADKGGFYHK